MKMNAFIQNSRKETIVIAIDGKCGSGKTTLSNYLHSLIPSNLFHLDDFFLQSYQRTEERLSEIGGNVDYERFNEEVVQAIKEKRPIEYIKYNCSTSNLEHIIQMNSRRINIVEGSYSHSPRIELEYDMKIFIDIPYELQLDSIRKRNGIEKLEQFKNVWIPKENKYFEFFLIKEKSDFIITVDAQTFE